MEKSKWEVEKGREIEKGKRKSEKVSVNHLAGSAVSVLGCLAASQSTLPSSGQALPS